MTIDASLVGRDLAPAAGGWNERDCRLYAMAVGAGSDNPEQELQFTTENTIGIRQRVLPTFAVIEGCRVGVRGLLDVLDDVDLSRMLHGTQHVDQHTELPLFASVVTRGRVTAVWDKQKAAVVETEATCFDAESGVAYFTCRQSLFFRGYGGWGGERGPSEPLGQPADPAPDLKVPIATRTDQALLYRLTGDSNPLHSDPAYARKAGFPRPILHGLCVYGQVGRVLLNELAGGDPSLLASISARFSAPTFPGDRLTLSVWGSADDHIFAVDNHRGQQVMTSGRFRTK
jgi:acyl dehydratase